MTTLTTGDIERIVREVLAEIGLKTPAPAAAPVEPQKPSPTAPLPQMGEGRYLPTDMQTVQPPAVPGDVIVESRLVTLAAIEGRLGGARRLVVRPRAVVTPAVRDELRRRNVALAESTATTSRAKQALPRLVLIVARTRHDPAALVRDLEKDGIAVETRSADCLMATSDQAAAEVAQSNTLVLIWTRHTAAALCLANRHPGVRAVLAGDAAATAAAVEAIGANVLVLDPTAGSVFQQRQAVGSFCRGGVRPCPEALSKRLG